MYLKDPGQDSGYSLENEQKRRRREKKHNKKNSFSNAFSILSFTSFLYPTHVCSLPENLCYIYYIMRIEKNVVRNKHLGILGKIREEYTENMNSVIE